MMPIRTLLLLFSSLGLLTTSAGSASWAQARGGLGPAVRAAYNGPGALLELLARPDVQNELELVADQLDEIAQLRMRFHQRMREAVLHLPVDGGTPPRELLRQTVGQLNRDLKTDLQHVLLPHQTRRLSQLELQLRLRGGALATLINPQLAAQLELAPAQQEQLRQKVAEAEREVRRVVAELRRQAQRDLLATLTAAQQEQFRLLVGEPFDFAERVEPVPADAGIE